MNKLSELLLEAADLLTEGAVKTNNKKKMDKWLKKYGYQGDKKEGTITVDGEKIKVDRDTKSLTAKTSNGQVNPRVTGIDSTSSEPKIILGKEFEKLKNKRKDAILNHEIGHIKYHNPTSDKITKKSRDIIIDSMAKDTSITNHGDDSFKDKVKQELNRTLQDNSKKPENYTDKDKIRHDNLDKLKKYEDGKLHSNRTEYEADIYASQQKNGDQIKRGIRDINKHTKNGVDRSIKTAKKMLKDVYGYDNEDLQDFEKSIDRKEIKKRINIKTQNDMNNRFKAMKDKSVNRQVYRESVELLLSEAIELLERE